MTDVLYVCQVCYDRCVVCGRHVMTDVLYVPGVL